MPRLPVFIFVIVFALSATLTQYLAYQQYKISKGTKRAELVREAAAAKDRFRNILFNDIAAANTLAIIYKQYGVPAKFDSVAHQILQNSRYAEALQITEDGIVRNVYPDIRYKATVGTDVNTDPMRNAEETRAIEHKDIYFAGPRRLRFGDTGILGKVPIIIAKKMSAVATVLTRLSTIKKILEAPNSDRNRFAYQLLKIQGKQTVFFPLSDSRPAAKSVGIDLNIPEGDWQLRVSYGDGYAEDKFPFVLSGLGLIFSFIAALLVYRKAQDPYKLNKIIDEKTDLLVKSEKYFRTLIETSSDAIVLLDSGGKVLYQSLSADKILGYSLAEIQQIDGIQLIHPDDREAANNIFYKEISVPGAIISCSHRIKHKNGNYIYIEGTYRNLLHDDHIKAIVYNYKDITERKAAEKEIHRLTRLYQFISSINESMLKAEDIDQIYAEACRIAVEIGGFQMAWIGTYNESNDSIIPVAWCGHEDGFLTKINVAGMKVYLSAIPSARAIREKKHFYYNDIANDPDIPADIKQEMIKRDYLSGVSFPIFVDGRIVAAMVLLMSEPFFFNKEEIELLRDVTHNITYALDKIKIQEMQNRSEANLRSVFDSTDVSYLLLDTKYSIIALNQQMKDVYWDNVGIKLIEGDNLIELIVPERRQSSRAVYDKVLQSREPGRYEASFNNRGVITHFSASVFPIIVGDEAIGLCISTIDITERKIMYDELKKSEATLRSIFDTTEVNYMLLDANYDIVAINQQSIDWQRNLTGVLFEKGVNVINALLPEKREPTKALFDKVILTNHSEDYETSYLNDGVYTHFLANVKPIHDGKKAIGICITEINITKQKIMTLELLNHVNAIEEQNKKLREIAWIQSHVVRAPLSRLMGLIDLFSNQENDDEDKRTILSYILISANELDEVVKDITDKV